MIKQNQKQEQITILNDYYSIEPLIEKAKSLNCPFVSAIGGKGNGKTYSSFTYALKEKAKNNRNCVYLRNYDKTIDKSIIGTLVSVHKQDIINLFKGKYNTCALVGKNFELQRVEEKNGVRKVVAHEVFCYCRSLNTLEGDTGADIGLISCVIYDEFLTRGSEIRDCFYKLMIAHNNFIRNRCDYYVPFILLGNTVSRDSECAKGFGIELRKLNRGITAIRSTKNEYRIIIEYCEQTRKQLEADETYYSRFDNDHIRMITKGEWTLGQYPIGNIDVQNSETCFTYKLFYNNVAVNVDIKIMGITAVIFITNPSEQYDLLVSVKPSAHSDQLTAIPKQILQAVSENRYYVLNNDVGENFRDICKHIPGGKQILMYLE
ncbi:MAG: hypothetical protein MJZ37_08470 [Bacilli bacterium]|nr:hypothetical protein [Bacilli bacterium]